MPALLAALHVHSTYSDGEFSLAEVRAIYERAGCAVVCVTDHAEGFTETMRRRFVEECERLSDDRVRLVPGLEYECDRRLHVLGYGLVRAAPSADPADVIAFIEAHGGVSVIAHPNTELFPWIEGFATLPMGVEAWNSKYDGRYAPRPETFALIARLQRRRPALRAFYGQDLHWRKQYRGLLVRLDAPTNAASDVLMALRRGAFEGQWRGWSLPSDGAIAPNLLRSFARRQAWSRGVRRVVRGMKAATGGWAARLPAPIKAQLRRIF